MNKQMLFSSSSILMMALMTLWFGCASPTPETVTRQEMSEQTKTEWVEETLARLTLEERISQMIMSRSYGYYYSTGSEHYKLLHQLTKVQKVGGLIFFQGDVYETAEMINRCQEWADVPLLVAADFEWGAAMRIRRATRFPEAMAVGATRNTKLAFEMGKAIGEESRAMGVHFNFAPTADVNVNPKNPVINTRSFSENPKIVAELAGAYAAGLQSGGALATAKHFPGHGDTHVDSHIDLPSVDATRARLDSVELVPFRALIQSGVASVMVAHLTVPSVDPTKGLPSTLSKPIVTDLLKNELGFKGLIVTDALDMGAVVNAFGSDSTAVRAVSAGADILLILPDEDGAIEALMNAVESGRITRERIDYSVRKILGVKYDLGLQKNRFTDLHAIREAVATQEHFGLAKQIARESITLVKNLRVLPFEKTSKKFLSIAISESDNVRTEINRNGNPWPNEPAGNYFLAQMKRRVSNIEQVMVTPSDNSVDYDSILEKARNASIIVLPVFSKASSGSGMFASGSGLMKFLEKVMKLGKPTVVVSLGSPYVLSDITGATTYLCAYSDCEISTEAAVEAMFGEIPTTGTLPVSISSAFPIGSGMNLSQTALRNDKPENVGFLTDSLALVDTIINKAIKEQAFPGAQLAILKDGAMVYNKSFGRFGYTDSFPKVNNQTMFDIASLTKVIATTSAIMKLYGEGKLALDEPVKKYIPEFANHEKDSITIRNLLLHNAGLPPFKQLYNTCKTPQELLDSVFQTELIYKTGDSTVYSDFGFITLGVIVERITKKSLNEYCKQMFFDSLGLKRTMFVPAESLRKNIAPTELDALFRKTLVQGVVHDENAFTMGGVSGHAGLFSTASDLAVFLQMLRNRGWYNGKEFLKNDVIKQFTVKQNQVHGSRALGWDTKTVNGYSSAGKYFSEQSFGHTGFTGTSVWVDPERNITVIFLTNRVYPTRANTKISSIRPLVHDAVIRALAESAASK